ncbi:sugar-binding transcriptional regulator [Luteimicrobium subarcticum]|uniref:DNA-binding transcriptional regulator LsrR (DeoR family) n=1 Tax=Luteimicrobium subarcticum TaxID=620910 RepID=A0A2M8WVW3_9MICO|nr:sugar-binding domain-containing protein [Luteimicrobium subarcticum]PJI95059.1 DNA-binding transcriptional regulator LsrR (DeoR family) [Luteimicrobium subarcticum]
MASTAERRRTLVRVAELYHLDHRTMQEVARITGLSRSTISRMLTQARAEGIVDVTVHRDVNVNELAQRVTARYGVAASVVVTEADQSELQRLEAVAVVGAERLRDLFGSDMTLVVPWGTTVSAIARHVAPRATHGSHVVQLNGSGNTFTSGIEYASGIIDLFGAAFDAEVHHFPVPAFFDRASTRHAMWEERSIRRVLALQRRADVALFSVGTIAGEVPSHLYRAGYLERTDVAELREEGVVGDVGSIFVRADGTSDRLSLNERSTGLPLKDLRRIPRRMLVATGTAKVAPVHAALLARSATDLVVDHETAQALLARPRASALSVGR